MARFRRMVERLYQTDEGRLAEETREWAGGLPGVALLQDVPERGRTKLAGAVRRITIRPVKGFDALDVLLSDGTGEVWVTWLGRRSIPGLTLGSHLVVEGVLGRAGGRRTMVNPTFEFAEAE